MNNRSGGQTGGWNDRRIESIVGNILRAGVLLSAVIVLLGGIVYVARHGSASPSYGVFRGEPGSMKTLAGIASGVRNLSGRGIVQLGLLLLIATPVARVVFSIFAFAAERDWLYVFVTVVVLAVLAFSLLGK